MNAVVCAWSFVLSVVCGFFFCCPLSSSYLGRVRRYRAVMNDALPVSRARVVCLPVLPFLVSSAAHLEDIHAGLAFLSGITKTTGVNQSSPTHPFHATTIQHSNIWIQNYWTSSRDETMSVAIISRWREAFVASLSSFNMRKCWWTWYCRPRAKLMKSKLRVKFIHLFLCTYLVMLKSMSFYGRV